MTTSEENNSNPTLKNNVLISNLIRDKKDLKLKKEKEKKVKKKRE
jgi:hypothetical protein